MGIPGLVIFDCDGVLVDSENISNGLLAELLSREGLQTTLAQARREYQGLLLSEVLERAQRRLGRELPEGWLERYEQERARRFQAHLRPVSGAAHAVERIARAGVAVCVASQGKPAKTDLSLALTGLDAHFPAHARFSAHCVARGKPWPDLFLHAAKRMGATPAQCVVLEDTPSGVSAAVAAQMRAIGYAADGDPQALHEAGAELLGSLAELPEALGVA